MSANPLHSGESDSRNSIILIVDGPGDKEVRPCPPSLLALLKAEREKIKRYEAMGFGPDTGECVNLIIDG